MPATYTETLTNPRDSLPNVYTDVHAREIDFVTRFGNNWAALQNILGIMRPIRKAPGTKLVAYNATVALESGAVGAGDVIPYSKAGFPSALRYSAIKPSKAAFCSSVRVIFSVFATESVAAR